VPPSFVQSTFPLLLAPLWLLLAAFACALLAQASTLRAGRAEFLVPRIGIGAVGLAMVSVLLSAASVVNGATVIDPSVSLFRIGSLDACLGFVLDKLSLPASLVVLVVVGLALLGFAPVQRASRPRETLVALISGAGALTAALAEGFPTLLLGLSVAFWVARGFSAASSRVAADPRPAGGPPAYAMFAGALLCFSLAAAVMFWALGGRWLDDTRYLSDYRARFVISTSQPSKPGTSSRNPMARGTLTIVSHPGARVYDGVANESHLAREEPIGLTPLFRSDIAAGLHKIAIAPGGGAIVGGDGLEVALIDTVDIREGVETIISLSGPTLTFHEIAPQLAGADLAGRRLGKLYVGPVIAALLLLGFVAAAGAMIGSARRGASMPTVGAATVLVALATFACRAGPLAIFESSYAAAGTALLAAIAAWASWRYACVAAPAVALFGCAVFAGASGAALVAACAIAPAMVALALWSDEPVAQIVPSEPVAEAPLVEGTKRANKKKKRSPARRDGSTGATPPAPVDRDAGSDSRGSAHDPRTSKLVMIALAAVPIPLFGPFAALGAVFVSPLRFGYQGALLMLVVLVVWASLAWSAGQIVRDAPKGVGSWVALVAACFACFVTPVLALVLQPWAVEQSMGVVPGLAISLAPFLAAALLFARAQKRPAREPVLPGVRGFPFEPMLVHARRIITVVDGVASLPLFLAGLAVERRSGSGSSGGSVAKSVPPPDRDPEGGET